MKIIADETYHIYNQGNNQETIFYEDADYVEFLNLFRKFVLPKCKVLAYCLMPNPRLTGRAGFSFFNSCHCRFFKRKEGWQYNFL